MRFAIAIGILVQGLVASKEPPFASLLTSRTRSTSNPRRNILSQVRRHRILSRKPTLGNGLAEVKSEMHLLQNRIKCVLDVGLDADTGILANQCLPGEFCSESGYCVGVTPGVEIRQTPSYRVNDTRYDENSQYSYYDLLCLEGSGFDYYDCDCTNVDTATQSGKIYCTTRETTCSGDACFDGKIGFAFNGTLTEYTDAYSCYNFSTPYKQDICYIFTGGSEECSISIDDVKCNSCQRVEDDTPDAPSFCSTATLFDCTNIPGGNAGNDCVGDRAADIFENFESAVPVDENVSFLGAILNGISSMSIQEQAEWATLTAEYIVSYFMTEMPNLLQDLRAQIGVLTVIPYESSGRPLNECGGSLKIVYNTYLSYLIEDPNSISPLEVAQLPFLTEADQSNYTQLLLDFGSGDLSCIYDIDPLGQQKVIRPERGAKKSKKTSKKSKSSKSDKKGSGKGTRVYKPPPLEDLIADEFIKVSKKSKRGKEVTTSMDGSPDHLVSSKISKKGKSRR